MGIVAVAVGVVLEDDGDEVAVVDSDNSAWFVCNDEAKGAMDLFVVILDALMECRKRNVMVVIFFNSQYR